MPYRNPAFRNQNRQRKKAESRNGNRNSIGFLIKIISPATNRLCQSHPRSKDIQHHIEPDVPPATENESSQQPGNNPAVNCQPSFPDIQDRQGMSPENRPGKSDIIKPGPQNSQREHPQGQIDYSIFGQVKAVRFPTGQKNCQRYTHDNQDTIPWKQAENQTGRRSGHSETSCKNVSLL